MARFKNVSPLGRLEIPAVGPEPIEAGADFEVPNDIAGYFLAQPENYEPRDKAAKSAEIPAPANDETPEAQAEGGEEGAQ